MIKHLDLQYWADKYDKPESADLEALRDCFHSENGIRNGMSDADKITLAEVLLSGRRIYKDEKEFVDVYRVCDNYNKYFAVNPVFFSDYSTHIAVWRYDYRAYINAIPDGYASKALKNIYNQLGLQVDEADLLRIGASNNIYDMFLKYLKQESNGRIIDVDPKVDAKHFADASYLNMYLMFDKLGLEGRDVFDVMASIGTQSKNFSQYVYTEMHFTLKEMMEEAKQRSRGRMYPTFYESATVLGV